MVAQRRRVGAFSEIWLILSENVRSIQLSLLFDQTGRITTSGWADTCGGFDIRFY
jgi:hypothetical protein